MSAKIIEESFFGQFFPGGTWKFPNTQCDSNCPS